MHAEYRLQAYVIQPEKVMENFAVSTISHDNKIAGRGTSAKCFSEQAHIIYITIKAVYRNKANLRKDEPKTANTLK
jgi:hypothetical protein